MVTQFDLPTKDEPEGFTIYNGAFTCECVWDDANDCPSFRLWNNDDREKKTVLVMTGVDHFLMMLNVITSTRNAIEEKV